MIVRANHVVHQDSKTYKFVEQETVQGVPVAFGAGFPKYGKYKCRWSHAHEDSQTTAVLDAKWMDEEHIKCGQFPPKTFSAARADAQSKDGSKVFMVRVQPMIGLTNPDKQGAKMVYEPIEYADKSNGPSFRCVHVCMPTRLPGPAAVCQPANQICPATRRVHVQLQRVRN